MIGVCKLLSVVIDGGHSIAIAGITGEGHGILGFLAVFIVIDLRRDRSCIALCVLTGNTQVAVNRRLIFVCCDILHIGIFFQIVRHDLHQRLQAGRRGAVHSFTESEMRHGIGSAVNGNVTWRAAVDIVADDALDCRNKAGAGVRRKAVFTGVQRLPDGLAVRKG